MSNVVVVTGASAGVGRAAAQAFGRRGDCVALLARSQEGLDRAGKDVESAGGRGSALSYRAIPLQAVYCGAKFAIRGFTDSVRTELLHDKSRVHITMVQLPGLNTPQFNWCKTRLPKQPQPVPPIYQPEVAGEAIAWAAEHRRREVWVGGESTIERGERCR